MQTVADILGKTLYAFIYGVTGCGKTMLPMTLSRADGGSDVGIITAEQNGPTSLATRGYLKAKVEVLPGAGNDPFAPTLNALSVFRKDKTVTTVVVDGLTVISGRAIEFLSDGEGEKALGFEGWQQMLAHFRQMEGVCEQLTRLGKNVILTAWEEEPHYEDTMGGRSLAQKGRPLLQGKAKTWLPGNVDVIARMTSRYKREGKGLKWEGRLDLKPTGDWLGKTRWDFLPSPHPPDLKLMLDTVRKYRPVAPKIPAPMGKKP